MPTVRKCLLHFAGRTACRLIIRGMSDRADELTGACEELGWIPEPSAPNRRVRNLAAERSIRTTTDGARCALLQSGLPLKFWHEAERHFSMASTITMPARSDSSKSRFEAITGRSYGGFQIPFGALCYYIAAKTSIPSHVSMRQPGIFSGMGSGSKL